MLYLSAYAVSYYRTPIRQAYACHLPPAPGGRPYNAIATIGVIGDVDEIAQIKVVSPENRG